jgi:hypothetical protein
MEQETRKLQKHDSERVTHLTDNVAQTRTPYIETYNASHATGIAVTFASFTQRLLTYGSVYCTLYGECKMMN